MRREIETAARPHKLMGDFIAPLTLSSMLILRVGDLIGMMTRMASITLTFPDRKPAAG
jgi:hypothetical protein